MILKWVHLSLVGRSLPGGIRRRNPDVSTTILLRRRRLLVVILAEIVILILPTALSFLLAGFVLGMVVRDLQRFRHWARLCPMYEKILAWDEIEALLADER